MSGSVKSFLKKKTVKRLDRGGLLSGSVISFLKRESFSLSLLRHGKEKAVSIIV